MQNNETRLQLIAQIANRLQGNNAKEDQVRQAFDPSELDDLSLDLDFE